MREFQVGDRVQYGSSGRVKGVVLEVGYARAKVQFDDEEDISWPRIRDLRLITPTKKKVEPLPLPG